MLVLSGLKKTFHAGTSNEVRALDGVSLRLPEGEFATVIGTNGSGKSTLLNAVAGTFRCDEGRIELDGAEMGRWPEHRRAALVGRVFQNPLGGTAPQMSIAENMALAARRGLSRGLAPALTKTLRAEIAERVATLRMNLESRLDTPIGTLSGGQRQALTLLMATWLRPRLLLLDEHTAALDPKSADQIVRITAEIVARDRLTTLMVTHSMQQASQLGTRILMMNRGRLAHDLSGEERARTRPDDLLARFDALRRRDQMDEGVAAMLRRQHV
jgi:putative ABC transport system ATP-binding protein